MINSVLNPQKGGWVLLSFVAFFGLIAIVNGVFIYNAIGTHSGVVIEHPYEKGLAFNDVLEKAKKQPELRHEVSFVDGILRWKLPVENANVKAQLIRSVQNGYDFDIILSYVGDGTYEARPQLPLKGIWSAKLKASWNNQEFQATHDFLAQ